MASTSLSRPEVDSPEPEGGGRKRRRVAIACEKCRNRKRKCDGVKPICGSCSGRSNPCCVWNEERHHKGWSNSYVEELRSRISVLEAAQGATNQFVANGSSLSSRDDEIHMAPPLPEHPRPMSVSRNTDIPTGNESNDDSLIHPVPLSDMRVHGPETCAGFLGCGPDIIGSSAIQDDRYDEDGTISDDTEVDAMGVVGSIESVPSQRTRRHSGYFGPSSIMNLLGQTRETSASCRCTRNRLMVSDASQHRNDSSPVSNGDFTNVSSFSRRERTDASRYSMRIPPRAQADSLLESYWISVHSLFPFLHWPSFQARYFAVWDPQRHEQAGDAWNSSSSDPYSLSSNGLFFCLLNVVFAMGALFDTAINPSDRDDVSRSFFQRAKSLLHFDIFAHGSLALVQILLLMGQYLQSTDESSSCWNVVGLAIRIAQCIGLHEEPKPCGVACQTRAKADQLELEMRRRVWTGCTLLDRVLSLTYGRPFMIQSSSSVENMVLPAAIDDEYLVRYPSAPGEQPPLTPSLIECYVQSTKLKDILIQVLGNFNDGHQKSRYTTDSGAAEQGVMSSSKLQRLLDIDSLLVRWHKQLPKHLRIRTYKEEGTSSVGSDSSSSLRTRIYRRQGTVLEARFLHTRLLLLRPALTVLQVPKKQRSWIQGLIDDREDSEEDSIQSNMSQGMLVKAANICVSTALDLVHLLSAGLQSDVDYLPAPWYNVFYIYSCAMILFTSSVGSATSIDCVPRPKMIEGFNCCVDFLGSYQWRNRSARRCCKFLRTIGRAEEGPSTALFNVYNMTIDGAAPLQRIRPDFADNIAHYRHEGVVPQEQDIDVSTSDFNLDVAAAVCAAHGEEDWIYESSDVAWLSMAPFLGNMDDGAGLGGGSF
ncbi:fungal-specific transcription factor domain-containing protein [Astrocystis sublimbata]|nr:fungal-specific transcription factor domain-containing protein [Astrocystis sublimbata]